MKPVDPTCQAGPSFPGQDRLPPPRAHLVLPAHALHIHHLVTPVLLQDLGLLLCQVAQLLGAALQVVVEAAQALPSPDGSFLPTQRTETVSVLSLGSPSPLLLFPPRTTLLFHIQQEIPRNFGEKSCYHWLLSDGAAVPFPSSQTRYVCLTRIQSQVWAGARGSLRAGPALLYFSQIPLPASTFMGWVNPGPSSWPPPLL